ncbi:Fe(3+) dicitrate transport ATP-binding protein fecE [Vibrio nigripulchritudo SO65]|uniref:ATP-binding cassette domain-containing protein n=1 Tax=Vibrio nigripulchritudo TaxID=28173 RepID=UPI0003B2000F|nr:ATP-binding cassette domain-containing protein [Vibrio nigripulchritudo]CCN37357.1 Fe(3+) dicitrate transport ATP-binding protein fecE [Vibrio nigripulchritudo AM115]CCN38882.1 Fe(3+) dicitrate transport ATP-binding protein fecE [Vibrio nigripulchritudo FTn2]CCN66693.1 Fe(3+) dicitrate transport ATP-binding protein fecE [Vibrio nigripulchritudo POn4]CCN76096.1 Fe(3+) dicitrate transport ATP-binding protein fecE [Vibrio nigripulchritudo SO65]
MKEIAAFHAMNVTLGYQDTTIIQSMTASIKKGKLTALIGPNGCGKSTFLKSLVRLLKPSNGQIQLYDEKPIHQYKDKEYAKYVSLLPQTPIVPEGVTVRELVGYGRAPYLNTLGRLTKEDKQRVEDAMVETGTETLADRRVDELSGGQRQRVWIAMVLAQNTDIILLDEPTTYLDLSHQYELLHLLVKLVKQGKTVVVVLHDLSQACRYADELMVVKSGELYAQGNPKEVFTETMLAEVFDLDARIIDDPESHTPMAIPKIPSLS